MCLFTYSSYILWCRKKKINKVLISSEALVSLYSSTAAQLFFFLFFKFLISFYDKFKFPSEGEKKS